jgi:hypothetical protein
MAKPKPPKPKASPAQPVRMGEIARRYQPAPKPAGKKSTKRKS